MLYIQCEYKEIFLKSLKRSFLVIARLISDHLWHCMLLFKQIQANGLAKLLLGHCYVADPRESQSSFLFSFT